MNNYLNINESLESNLIELNHDDLIELNGGYRGRCPLTGLKIVAAATGALAATAFSLGFIDGIKGK